jgi:hypothetical protein
VLNWAAYGLWEDQNKHLLSDKEVADKKKLSKRNSNLLYRSTPKGKVVLAAARARHRSSNPNRQGKRREAQSNPKIPGPACGGHG